MASGASTEPPPLPPADYTPVSKEEWAKTRMPPLKGVIVDPEYPPTAEEALQAIKNHDRNYESQWQGQQTPCDLPSSSATAKPTSRQSTLTPSFPTTPASSSTQIQTEIDSNIGNNPNRSSGSSKIFGRVAGDSSASSPSSSTSTSTTPTSSPLQHKNPQDITTWDILTSLSPTDFRSILSQPCFRETFMYSLISGVLVAGTLWTLGKKRQWIVNGGMGTSAAMYAGVFPYCMWTRKQEKRNVMLVKETWEETRAEKRAAWEAYKDKTRRDDELKKIGLKQQGQSTTDRSGSAWSAFWRSSGNGGSQGPRGREG